MRTAKAITHGICSPPIVYVGVTHGSTVMVVLGVLMMGWGFALLTGERR